MDEIELTFLLGRLPDGLSDCDSKLLLDIYIPGNADHPKLRLRRSGARFELTKKELVDARDASHQTEATVPLTEAEFSWLRRAGGKAIEKRRYLYAEGGHTYEIDVFGGALAGLVLADVEFASLEDKAKFKMPDWLLADVTQEDFIAGGRLCGRSYEDIGPDLARFDYAMLHLVCGAV